MDPLTAHARAQSQFGRVLAGVTQSQYGGPTPCEEWTVHDLVEHVIAGNNRAAAGHLGLPVGQAQTDQVADGADPNQLFAESAERAGEAFGAPDGLTRTIEMSFGSLPGSVVIGMRTTDVLVHAWDLAVATGQSSDLDPELAALCLDTARQRVQESFRGPGRPFGPEQACPPGRPLADQLAAFMGRRVSDEPGHPEE